ncbi:MAG: hypothetical protein K2P02_08375 [Lachnospiraceae bacterium]|nr:hypothetical protein [Lachnospiraceae bacterium]
MKKLVYCLCLFFGTGLLCLTAALLIKSPDPVEGTRSILPTESQTRPMDTIVINQKKIEHTSAAETPPYCLVSEDGFLLVFRKDQDDVCLYTHIPITDFPKEEQDRLREGIWFSTMLEIYSYLESYTS